MNTPTIRDSGIIDVTFGENVTIVKPVNMYGCLLGDDVFIGPFVEVQRCAKIGSRTKVQSHAFICELVDIGEDCFISHGVMFVNDLFKTGEPAHGNKTQWKKTTVGNNVYIGSNATILPVSICDKVVIGAGAVVTKDISVEGIYAGTPARLIRQLTL